VALVARTTLLLLSIFVLCGCASETTSEPKAPVVERITEVDPSAPATPGELRRYLREWEAAWSRWTADLAPRTEAEDNAPVYNPTPDASWEAMHRLYGRTATAYQRLERRLAAIPTPGAMLAANDAYRAALRRQKSRLQDVSDAFAGSDPSALNRALMALSNANVEGDTDQDGARWERAVIAACKASGVPVPRIVRLEFISNGQRTH
jgi:hypothetical protein